MDLVARESTRIMPETGGNTGARGYRSEGAGGLDYYADSGVTPGALTLINHPIVHGVRIRNHMIAEGMLY